MDDLARLVMRREGLDDLPRPVVEFGYLARTWRPGDDRFWSTIIEGIIDPCWTPEAFTRLILKAPNFDARGLFFVTLGSRPAGTACAWRSARGAQGDGRTGSVRMMAVLDEHRGRGLGRFLALKALHYLREAGYEACEFAAEDCRVGAIKTCLGLSFQPVMTHESHPARWEAVLRRIREGRREGGGD